MPGWSMLRRSPEHNCEDENDDDEDDDVVEKPLAIVYKVGTG